MLLPMFFRCDSDRLRIPVRKALLIIPAGGCVNVRVSVCASMSFKRELGGQSANHYGAFFSIFQPMFESDLRHESTYFCFCVEGGSRLMNFSP